MKDYFMFFIYVLALLTIIYESIEIGRNIEHIVTIANEIHQKGELYDRI